MKVVVCGEAERVRAPIVQLRRRAECEFALIGATSRVAAELGIEIVPRPVAILDRLDAILGAVHGRSGELSWSDPAWAIIESVAAADGVLIAGASSPDAALALLPEQVLVARLARAFNKPLVISGESMWLQQVEWGGAWSAEVLQAGTLVGLCGRSAYELASTIVDDVASLRRVPVDELFVEEPTSGVGGRERGPVVVDLSGLSLLSTVGTTAFAELLETIAGFHDGELIVSDPDGIGDGITAALRSSYRRWDGEGSTAGLLVGGAAVYVTGRAETCRTAIEASVPFIAIATGGQTDRRLADLASDFGLTDWVLPVASVVTGDAAAAIPALSEDGVASTATIDRRRVEIDHWWNEVLAALGRTAAVATEYQIVEPVAALPDPLRSKLVGLREVQSGIELEFTRRRRSHGVHEEWGTAADAALAALELEVAEITTDRDTVRAELAEAQAALRAAHGLVESKQPTPGASRHRAAPARLSASIAPLASVRRAISMFRSRSVAAMARVRRRLDR